MVVLVGCRSGAGMDADAAGDEGRLVDGSRAGLFDLDRSERRGDGIREGREMEPGGGRRKVGGRTVIPGWMVSSSEPRLSPS